MKTRPCCFTPSLLRALALAGGALACASAQVPTNIKFQNGTSPALVGGRLEILPSKGQKAGGNLFHSFSDFSVGTGHTAVFKTPSDVSNILARVTGGSASSIDGTLRTEQELSGNLSGANLYLINPAGILFGPNAKLEIGGSFTATTADYVRLKDGGRFDARNTANDVLTTAPVSAFGFLGPQAPAGVSLTRTVVSATDAHGFHLAAGSVKLDGAQIFTGTAPITMQAARAVGEIPATPPVLDPAATGAAPTTGGPMEFLNGALVTSLAGGRISLRAGEFEIVNSVIFAAPYAGSLGDDIEIESSTLILRQGRIQQGESASGTETGPSLTIHTGLLDAAGNLDAPSLNGIILGAGAAGNLGDLHLRVDGKLSLAAGAIIVGVTGLNLQSGTLFISAGAVDLDGSAKSDRTTGIFGGSLTGDLRNGSKIDLTVAGDLRLVRGGFIGGFAGVAARGSDVAIHARSLLIDGFGLDQFTGISVSSPASGRAGDLQLTIAGPTTLRGHGQISSNAYADGAGGNIELTTGSLSIDDDGEGDLASGLTTSAFSSRGNAGNITINSRRGNVSVLGFGEIVSDTYGAGKAGDIQLDARSLTMGGIISSEAGEGSSGAAGNLAIRAGSIEMRGGSSMDTDARGTGPGGRVSVRAGDLSIYGSDEYASGISSDTSGPGAAGDVFVRAERLLIDGQNRSEFTGISSDALEGSGNAGQVRVIGRSIVLRHGAQIASDTEESGRAGLVEIRAGSLELQGSSSISSSTHGVGRAGNLTVTVSGGLRIHGKDPVERSGLFSNAFSRGAAGDIQVQAGEITLSRFGAIAAVAFSDGAAGSVHLQADRLIVRDGGAISTESVGRGRAGQVTVDAGSVLLDQAGADSFTGIAASSSRSPAGDLTLRVGDLTILAGSGLSTSTFGGGSAGNIKVQAGTILLEGARETFLPPSGSILFGGIASTTEGGTGAGGNVSIEAGELAIRDQALITVRSTGAGASGRLRVSVDRLTLDGGSISAEAQAQGAAGSVTVQAGSILLAHASTIGSASVGTGSAGSVEVRSRGLLVLAGGSRLTSSAPLSVGGRVLLTAGEVRLDGSSSVTASAGGDGGTIEITTPLLLTEPGSSFTAAAGLLATANASGAEAAGSGGNITIAADFLLLDRALVSANAAAGQGGNITLASEFFFNSNSLLSATGSTAGTIFIRAPELDLTSGLVGLTSSLIDASAQLRDQCARKLQRDFSSYLRLGRGGQVAQPEEAGASF